jgi:S1-C subfamily serine protease
VFALNRELISAAENRDITFQVRRGNSTRNLTIRMVPEENRFNAALIQKKTGLTLRQLTAQDAARLGLKGAGGFVVADIERNSPADHAGFQRGFIVAGIDGLAPDSITTAARLLAPKQAGESARLTLIVPRPLRREEVDLKVR